MSRWLRHHMVEAMPGHLIGWVIGGAIVAFSGVSPDEWVAHLVHSTPAFLPSDWSASTSALVARSSFAGLGLAVLSVTLLLGLRTKEPIRSAATIISLALPSVSTAPLALPDKPSIAVLPFQNLSDDKEQEYFCDGMVEDITTALSRLKWLFVIARDSTFTYKSKSVGVKQVGRELGVRYVLEGSVRKANNRVRIAGQLIDAATGAHIWGDRFEGELADVFDLQDKITSSVVGAIEPAITDAEIRRALGKQTESLDAYDYYLRALSLFQIGTAAALLDLAALCGKAIAIDPNYALAHGLIAMSSVARFVYGWTYTPHDRSAGIAAANRAIELADDDPRALWMGGMALLHLARDFDRGGAVIERALSIDPNMATAWNMKGYQKFWCGEGNAAIECFEQALRLSPRDPRTCAFKAGIGWAHFVERRYEDAIKWSDAALADHPLFITSLRCKISSLALLGRTDESKQLVASLLQHQPDATIATLRAMMPMRRPEDMSRYLEGLREAGLPE